MIYTSKKVDEWIVVDINTGDKIDIISSDSPMCPTKTQSNNLPNAFESTTKEYSSRNLLYLFKREYQISVYNSHTREKLLNFSYVDFSPSILSSIPQNMYELIHVTSSTNGKVETLDMTSGGDRFLWSHQFASPIISMYKLSEKSNFPVINRIPFTTIGGLFNVTNFFHHNSLFPSVYVGEIGRTKSFYALSAFVEYSQLRKDSLYLIEGPKNETSVSNNLGYYKYPELSTVYFNMIRKSELITAQPHSQPGKVIVQVVESVDRLNHSHRVHMDTYTSMVNYLVVVIICLVVCIVCLIVIPAIVAYRYFYRKSSSNSSKEMMYNQNIGKISYNSTDIIGRGCAGTCVYKGLFEKRQQVAVKRVIADCFQLANREIELLRKLQHPHLIRYFATERDHQFLYIAIELAELTLADYVEKRSSLEVFDQFNHVNIMYQSCLGLAHLHSLNIVHRDIKPQNILISIPIQPNNIRKVMISDFGVSKILNSESLTTDFSAGTEGWIAPEILKAKMNADKTSASKPNDIFSIGCLIYYTHTSGGHPFGNLLSRQSNIICGSYDLSEIDSENELPIYSLVKPMISNNPEDRPDIEVVIKHPYFWNGKQTLQFLQDVSDRIECENVDSKIIEVLENGGIDVCQGDWRRHLSIELQEDLKKFRSYKGSSVRELLRAIRNKRHHYYELDPQLQKSLGKLPEEFVTYFTSKFPRLIIHSYISMQMCRQENIFQHYYYSKNGNAFEFDSLPRSPIRWFEKLKEDESKGFVFKTVRKRGTNNKENKKQANEDKIDKSPVSLVKNKFNMDIINDINNAATSM